MKFRCRKDKTEFEPKPTPVKDGQVHTRDRIVRCPKCGGTDLEFM